MSEPQNLFQKKKGAILIMVLWSLGCLAIFAIGLGVVCRQKIVFLSRIENREMIKQLRMSSVKKAIALINETAPLKPEDWTVQNKKALLNNEEAFAVISLGSSEAMIGYQIPGAQDDQAFQYGVQIEESKVNLNFADQSQIGSLLQETSGLSKQEADDLAVAILDWRKVHSSELTGFESDKYYENLIDPYSPKNADFESLDELLLIRGMTDEIFKAVSPYLTVYGDGKVNINAASEMVFVALGLSIEVVQQIVSLRRGSDGLEGTDDDVIFMSPGDLLNAAGPLANLKDEERQEIRGILDKLTSDSHFYFIENRVKIQGIEDSTVTQCVYDLKEHKITYWKEGFAF